jgi:hypothetical protein
MPVAISIVFSAFYLMHSGHNVSAHSQPDEQLHIEVVEIANVKYQMEENIEVALGC